MPQCRLALNTELAPDSTTGAAPARVEVIPAGPTVQGRDGRAWTFDAADAAIVIAAFNARGVDLPIDWEHATEHRAPVGLDAPAAGWITGLTLSESGALVSDVSWTPRGNEQVVNREYRYLSPVFEYQPDTRRIVRLLSVGLTNRPNLFLQALNREEILMNRSALLAAAIVGVLGLSADATDDAVATAINTMKTARDDATARATNAEKAAPALDRYVPRADYDALVTRAANAEQALKDKGTAEHKAAVDAAIGDALKAGKITPATEAYHRAACADAEGLTRFREFAGAAPVIAADPALKKKPDAATTTALNAEELVVCAATGVSPEEFAKAKAA